ncbi:ribonuclease H-like domain-containing protein [Natronorubrum aibiense]|uniref:YprB ribonuclease H-like domain-containing protein n=1 Tax=Natronorubrum aibiense TaxID=348826 RepID=A0A5P9P625_9EURY|nr:ribonuclease H-like domain-containing protein [Natronorubrum aibiense]QFU83593.1 hypothetical protein GCU68_14110 [Natronorubrum aibiense]
MTARADVSLLALPPSALVDRPVETLADVDVTLEPDAVWVLGPDQEPQAFARARQVFDAPTFHPPLETGDGPLSSYQFESDDLELAVCNGVRSLQADQSAGSSAFTGSSDVVALVCDDVATNVRPTTLETSLEGAATLAAALPTGRVTTVLTGSEPAGYDELWHLEADTGAVCTVDHEPAVVCSPAGDDCVSVRVRGGGPVEGYGSDRSIAKLSLSDDGIERVETYSVTTFGLEAVSGIGPKTATRLTERGVRTRTELLEVPLETLAELPGVGCDRARTIHQHATVLETGEPRRRTDEPLPGERWSTPPLCLDIETDGLSPTIIWQIGVYDPVTDTYRAFVERDEPTDPGPVLEAFCDWLLGIHPDRALLTWNGWRFDYRHLGSFIARYVPYYADDWESIPTFDLYAWAVRNEHAILPGRTNELAVVADALGYEGAATGLDGARTAAAYQRFMRTGEPLEWGRHEAYCEDDCRALWHVYERLRDASAASSAGATESGTTAQTTGDDANETIDSEQTGLGDF